MPANAALLVIDVQHGLCEGEYAAFEAKPLVKRINALAKQARAVKAPVFWIHHEEADGLLQHGAPGWQLAKGLDTDAKTSWYARAHQTLFCAPAWNAC